MAVAVKLCCSECESTREVPVSRKDKEIFCPMCGRKAANLNEADLSEIETVLAGQRVWNIIAGVFFVVALVCAVFWLDPNTKDWLSNAKVPANAMFFAGFLACGVVAAVCAAVGARKRYLIEF